VYLLDVNVVLAAHRRDHPHHGTVRPWFDRLAADDEPFTVPVVVWASFLRLATNRRILIVPLRELVRVAGRRWTIEESFQAYPRNEAMTNEVYRPYGSPWACLYDRRAHTEKTLRQVRQVHPRLLERGGRSIRASFPMAGRP